MEVLQIVQSKIENLIFLVRSSEKSKDEGLYLKEVNHQKFSY